MFSRAMSCTIITSGSTAAARPVGASFSASCFLYQRAVRRMTTSSSSVLIISASTFLVMERSSGLLPVTAFTSLPSSLRV